MKVLAYWYWMALAAWARWQLDSTEDYLRACTRDGLTDSLSLREFRKQCEEQRVRWVSYEDRAEKALKGTRWSRS